MTGTTTPTAPVGEPPADDAPPRARRIRARYVVALVVCLGAVVWMITSLKSNIDYWKPVAQAVHDRGTDGGKHLRVGGLVVPGTVHGSDFDLSDGAATLHVRLVASDAAATPKPCTPLVVAGRWRGQLLVADELTRRHGSDYSSKAHELADDTPVSSCRSKL